MPGSPWTDGVAPVTIETLFGLVNDGICAAAEGVGPAAGQHCRQARHQAAREGVVEVARVAPVDGDDHRRAGRDAVLAGVDRDGVRWHLLR